MQHSVYEAIVGGVMKSYLDVLLYSKLVKKSDVLERTRHSGLVDIYCVHALGTLAVKEDLASCRLIHFGEHVEDGSLAGTVRADESADLRPSECQVEVVYGSQSAEVDAEALYFEYRRLVSVFFRDVDLIIIRLIGIILLL